MLFPKAEYDERLSRLYAFMDEHNVAVVIADEAEMLHYFTGFAISENLYRAVLIPREGPLLMIVRTLDEHVFLKLAWFDNRRIFDDVEDPVAIVAQVIEDWGCADARIGLDMNSYCMPAKRFSHLRTLLPSATYIDFSDVFRPMRLKKSPREIIVMQKSADIADEAMRRAIAAAKPGASSRTAAAMAAASFMELGADFGRTGPITVGKGWNFLHGKLSDDPLEPGDVLHLELVPKVSGYCSRLMRPAVMGEPSGELRDAADALIALQDRQIAAMVPGAVAGEVDAMFRQAVLDAGLRQTYVNNTGYTLGYYFEQAPRTSDFTRRFTPKATWRLEAGMTFHMYTSADIGMAFSETVLVDDDGPERLTRLERKLFRCGEAR
ncbi:MAG: Xaa-Pro peptidase family protein [Hyphomicrobiaceae bacterium]|nr:Xaa-Pro peptidase family protein [Hyphomicrobiaceae bacterium]